MVSKRQFGCSARLCDDVPVASEKLVLITKWPTEKVIGPNGAALEHRSDLTSDQVREIIRDGVMIAGIANVPDSTSRATAWTTTARFDTWRLRGRVLMGTARSLCFLPTTEQPIGAAVERTGGAAKMEHSDRCFGTTTTHSEGAVARLAVFGHARRSLALIL